MRIARVHLKSFGPFRDRIFEFARGMNVVYGPNEAGKSNLHSAMVAGMAGMRRGPGKRKVDREFDERYRPWSGEPWTVEIDLDLDDGRRIQIEQDLGNQVASRAIDLVTGGELTTELMNDGMPDASTLLGLTRSILAETICIRQGDILRVLENTAELQQQLQRAAATGGAGEPAEAAIQRIREFVKEQVGVARIGARKPLQRAIESVAEAARELESTRAVHATYLECVDRREQAEAALREAQAEFEALSLALEHKELERLRERVERARGLASGLTGVAPTEPSSEPSRLSLLQHAIAAFDARPAAPAPMHGRSIAELEEELDRLQADAGEVRTESEPQETEAPRRSWQLPVGVVTALAGLLLSILTTGTPRIAGIVAMLVGATLAILARLSAGGKPDTARQDAQLAEMRAVRAALEANQREQLQRELTHRREMERASEATRQQRDAAETQVRAAAATAGIAEERLEQTVEALRELERRIRSEAEQRGRERERRATLRELLGGRTLDELELQLEQRERSAGPHPIENDTIPTVDELEPLVREADARRDELRQRFDHLAGQVAAHEPELPYVADAEEEAAQADAELARVESLKETLERTLEFLEQARDRVQRDLAPVLTSSVARHLSRVTDERYHEVLVNPADLTVQVRAHGGSWRPASGLSHGTREQIYLLLRLGLAEHLVTTSESAPLLLDDPTVQSDASRTVAFLELLHEASRERQIILLSQEQEVVEWARRRLTSDNDRFLELTPSPPG